MMKLYIWTSLNALRDYGDGIAFAMADSVDHAREMLAVKFARDYEAERPGIPLKDWDRNIIARFATAIMETEPDEVHDKAAAGYLNGPS
jgi:hypothetical protein